MISLIFFFALVSADYVISQLPNNRATISTTDVCIVISSDESIEYVIRNDGSVYKWTYFGSTECNGNNNSGSGLGSNEILTKTIPKTVAYRKTGGKSDCSDHPDHGQAVVFLDGCVKSASGSYLKYTVESGYIYNEYFSDEECTVPLSSTDGIETKLPAGKCDVCDENTKYYCKPYNGTGLTSILMILFVLFFLF